MRIFIVLLLLFSSVRFIEASTQITVKKAQFIDDEPSTVELLRKEVQSLLAKVELLEHKLGQLERAGNFNLKPVEPVTANESLPADIEPTIEPTSKAVDIKQEKESFLKETDIFDIPTQDTIAEETKVDTEKQAYDLALAALKDNKLALAEQKFASFLVNYPKSSLENKVYFWYGETFFRRNIFDKAAINYLKSYKNSPKGEKASDALLKLALSLGSLKKNTEACNILTKLDQEFPNRASASIKRAHDAKIKFGCKKS